MATPTLFLTYLFAVSLHAEEQATPASLLGPRNFNHHPFEQYLREVEPEPTKQGPVLFPNDGPPPPRPPLIVTSRPLIESIARSELNQNNTITSQSLNREFRIKPDFDKPDFLRKPDITGKYQFEPDFLTTGKPGFLSRVNNYQPYAYPILTSPAPLDLPYSDVVKKQRLNGALDNRYDEFEERKALPPIYKAIGEYAQHKLLKLKHKPKHNHHYKNMDHRHHKRVHDEDHPDYDEGSNYAFSYRVKDHKTGDDFSHSQHSSGSATNGEYRVRLPDGRMQIVSYTADENGYKADVRYDDEEKARDNRIDHHSHIMHNHITHHNHVNHKPPKHYHDDYIEHPDNHREYVKYQPNAIDVNYKDLNYNQDYNRQIIDSNNYDGNKYFSQPTEGYQVKETFNEYADLSKEYNNDYSVEYDGKHGNYEPHRSKFSQYTARPTNLGTIVVTNNNKQDFVEDSTPKPTVRPSYEEIKHLFENRNIYSSTPNIEINVPSTTPNSNSLGETTERVVIIGTKPNLYTNVRIPLVTSPTPIYSSPSYVSPSTFETTSNFISPSSYLASTIDSLKVRNNKPILSESFINRLNKYLTFTK